MFFEETKLKGAYVIDVDSHNDKRGSFARIFCGHEFTSRGLRPAIAQINISHNAKRGTLRGLHFQFPPAAETKYVRCTKGALFDVIVDLRPESPTYLEHVAVELSAKNRRGLYVPERFAHGFLTLEDDTELTYMMGEFYSPHVEGGLPYDDPTIAVAWPCPVTVASDRDLQWRPLADVEADLRQRMAVVEATRARTNFSSPVCVVASREDSSTAHA
jgi:dTDP-4-dehydrorhamnose 3,5-epimerase